MLSLEHSQLLYVPIDEAGIVESQCLEYATFSHTYPNSIPKDHAPNSPVRNEFNTLLSSSIPLICTYLLQYSLVTITLLFVGRLGEKSLAAMSLACLTANVTGWSMFLGLASALDTLCPQAYGAGLKRAVGLHTQRMAVFLLLTSIPIGILWYNSHPLLHLFLHDEEICKMARGCLRILSLGLPGHALFECGKRYLRAQGHFLPGLYTFLILIPTHIFLTWLLVIHFQHGINGAALSLSITRSLLPLGPVIYSWLFTDGLCWRELNDGKIFQNWSCMVKLALPACLMVEVECIGFEILVVLAGLNGRTELCAQTLLVSVSGFIYRIPMSLGIAANTQISDLLGSGSPNKAKEVAKYSVLLAAGVGSLIVVLVLSFRTHIPYIFTNEEGVGRLMLDTIPLLGVFTLIDGITGVLSGIIRGMGKQYVGALIQTVGYYAIGVPCGIFAAFTLGWHLNGLWAGISIAMSIICVSQGLYVYYLDWDNLVEEANVRNALEVDV